MHDKKNGKFPLFIVGCERSGTTMLQHLIERHPAIWVPREETFFFPRLFPEFKALIESGKREDAARALSTVELVRKWGVFSSPEDFSNAEPIRAYGEAINAVMLKKAYANKKVRWCEKTPSYVFSIKMLAEAIPEARFLFIVRDGRDVSMSLSQLAWGPNNAYGVAKRWVNVYRAWKNVADTLGEKGLLMRYEDFLGSPKEWLGRIAVLIEQDDLEICLEQFRVRAGNSQKWKNPFFFTASEQRIFSFVAYRELRELGYETTGNHEKVSVWEKVLWSIDDFWRRLSNRILRRHNLHPRTAEPGSGSHNLRLADSACDRTFR